MGKYLIEIDDELLQGKVPVAFRTPRPEEWYLNEYRNLVKSELGLSGGNMLILEEPYTPPSWLKPGWIYPYMRNNDNWVWFWSNKEPKPCQNWWDCVCGSQFACLTDFSNFTPPTQRRPYKVG